MNSPESSESPEIPESPDMPDTPDTPDTPDMPDTPDTPDMPVDTYTPVNPDHLPFYSMPRDISALFPEWQGCSAVFNGIYDPPGALSKRDAIISKTQETTAPPASIIPAPGGRTQTHSARQTAYFADSKNHPHEHSAALDGSQPSDNGMKFSNQANTATEGDNTSNNRGDHVAGSESTSDDDLTSTYDGDRPKGSGPESNSDPASHYGANHAEEDRRMSDHSPPPESSENVQGSNHETLNTRSQYLDPLASVSTLSSIEDRPPFRNPDDDIIIGGMTLSPDEGVFTTNSHAISVGAWSAIVDSAALALSQVSEALPSVNEHAKNLYGTIASIPQSSVPTLIVEGLVITAGGKADTIQGSKTISLNADGDTLVVNDKAFPIPTSLRGLTLRIATTQEVSATIRGSVVAVSLPTAAPSVANFSNGNITGLQFLGDGCLSMSRRFWHSTCLCIAVLLWV